MKLFYSPGACSLAPHIILEELNKPYEAIRVNTRTHKYGDEDFYKINPLGTVPTLILDNGETLTQNNVILIYLGDLDPKHQLLPAVGSMSRLRCLEWLGFINSDLHKAFVPIFKPDAYVTSAAAKEELKKVTAENIKKLFAYVDNKLKGKQFAMGEQFTIIDAYLYVMYEWANYLKLSAHDYANYTALFRSVSERPATQRALKAEDLMK